MTFNTLSSHRQALLSTNTENTLVSSLCYPVKDHIEFYPGLHVLVLLHLFPISPYTYPIFLHPIYLAFFCFLGSFLLKRFRMCSSLCLDSLLPLPIHPSEFRDVIHPGKSSLTLWVMKCSQASWTVPLLFL